MAHIGGLRGRCTPGDAAVIDALRKLLRGEFSKAEAHDVWTTAEWQTSPQRPTHLRTSHHTKEGRGEGVREE